MGLLLNSFKLHKKELGSILNFRLSSFLFALLQIGFNQLSEDRVVDGQPVEIIEVLNELQTHRTPNSPVSE